MIDLQTENLISLAEAARKIPSRHPGKKIHVSTVWRWGTTGVKGVLLETVKVGGSTYTSSEALQRFSEALTEPRPLMVKHRPDRPPRKRDIEAAERICKEAGI